LSSHWFVRALRHAFFPSLALKGMNFMSMKFSDSFPGVLFAGILLAVFSTTIAPHAQAQAAATPSAEDAALEQVWIKASSKYDVPRAALLEQVASISEQGPYHADWKSLSKYEIPDWFKDAKFGIFIHWTPFSVPAYGNEWYPRNMYQPGSDENKHQVATYGPLTKFGYKDFIPMFKAEHFDAHAWAILFRQSGAKYVVPVFEHHDGFAMYNSGLSDWTVVKMGPHRDVYGELAKEVRSQGMYFGASSHRIEHDWFMDGIHKQPTEASDPKLAAFYGPAHHATENHDALNFHAYLSTEYSNDWLARNAEIVQKYHPDIMWFDWWIGNPKLEPYLQKFAAFYYNESVKQGTLGVINYKNGIFPEHTAVLDIERGQLSSIRKDFWQTDTSVSNKSWGYIDGDTFKSPEFIVTQLVDIVSKNGNLLLNIGPRADGTIPDEVQQTLRDVGAWLSVNGDAIYGTRPWKIFGEGPTKVVEGAFHDTDVQAYTPDDYRFTMKGTTLYAIELKWPSSGEAIIRSLASGQSAEIGTVSLLGSANKLRFEQKTDGLHIQLPAQSPGKYAYAFAIGMKATTTN
jgi:alpha-L-fucosidase